MGRRSGSWSAATCLDSNGDSFLRHTYSMRIVKRADASGSAILISENSPSKIKDPSLEP
jgi:hypothetical protein